MSQNSFCYPALANNDRVDASVYLFYAGTSDENTIRYITENIERGKEKGLPVYAWLMPTYHPSSDPNQTPIGDHTFRVALDAIYNADADGVVIWHANAIPTFDPTHGWYVATTQFIADNNIVSWQGANALAAKVSVDDTLVQTVVGSNWSNVVSRSFSTTNWSNVAAGQFVTEGQTSYTLKPRPTLNNSQRMSDPDGEETA